MSEGYDAVVGNAQARVGSTLKGKWTLERLIGVGGMAAVYAATHRNRKRVAVKMLHPELSMNASIRQRFLREGYVANSVEHTGAVAVDDDDVSEDGCAFLVMELLDGETLDARWERKGKRLAADEVLTLTEQVLDTLAAAHAKGVIHRDLKPENLFLTRSGQVKVLDFGIARVRELSQSTTKTQTGSTMGTPAFMPPEQARGRWEDVDGQSDIWAVGATMFTLLTGRFVHEASTVNEALVLAVTARARSVAELRPDLPRAVIEIVDRALAYEKSERWTDAAAMRTAVRRALRAIEAEEWDQPAHAPPRVEPPAASVAAIAPSEGGARQATLRSLEPEIPVGPALVEKPATLTTARGVERAAMGGKGRSPRATVLAIGAVLATAAAAIAVVLGSSETVSTDSTPASAPSITEEPATVPSSFKKLDVAPLASTRVTDAVSIDDLPVERPALPPKPAQQSRPLVELEEEPATMNPYVLHSAPTAKAPPPSSPASSSRPPADPFAARR